MPRSAVSPAICKQDRSHLRDIRARRSPLGGNCGGAARLRLWIHKAFVSGSSQSAGTKPRILSDECFCCQRFHTDETAEASVLKPPEVKVDRDDRTPSPPVRAALPPGQGTRIDQLA